jgi:hypothetical protein
VMRVVLFRHLPPWEQAAVKAPVGGLGLTRASRTLFLSSVRSRSGRRTPHRRCHEHHGIRETPANYAENDE